MTSRTSPYALILTLILTGRKVPDDIQKIVCTEAYNLIDAAYKYSLDADCYMFHAIMTGELTESIYHDECDMIDGVMDALQQA